MPVTQADLVMKRSEVYSDDPTVNGGGITFTNVGTNLFPDVNGTERTDGVTRWRKVFIKNEAGTGVDPEREYDPYLEFIDAKVFLQNTSASGDRFFIKEAATKNGVQNSENNVNWSGCGELVSNIILGGTSLEVRCEFSGQATSDIFQIGRKVLISDGTTREFVTLTGVSWISSNATLTFSGTPLQHSYTATLSETADITSANTIGKSSWTMGTNAYAGKRIRIISGSGSGQRRRIVSNTDKTFTVEYPWTVAVSTNSVFVVDLVQVSECISVGNIGASYTSPVVAGGGSFTPGITLYPVGCIDETWELLFSNTTTFTLRGTTRVGSLGSFVTTEDLKPVNGPSYYFKMNSTGFNSGFTNGSILTFNTVSSSKAFWIKEVVPPGTLAHLANSVDIGASGETV